MASIFLGGGDWKAKTSAGCPTPMHMHYSVLANIQQLPVESPKPLERYLIRTAILLNRSPTLTRPPTAFEAAMHEYYARIGRALSNPFPGHFYFKPGSLLKVQFNKEERQREKEAFNWKKKARRARSKVAGAPEATSESPEESIGAKGESGVGLLSGSDKQSSLIVTDEEEDVIMPRTTEADKSNDVRSLDRLGHRNLYLLIKGGGMSEWRLPGTKTNIQPTGALHEVSSPMLILKMLSKME